VSLNEIVQPKEIIQSNVTEEVAVVGKTPDTKAQTVPSLTNNKQKGNLIENKSKQKTIGQVVAKQEKSIPKSIPKVNSKPTFTPSNKIPKDNNLNINLNSKKLVSELNSKNKFGSKPKELKKILVEMGIQTSAQREIERIESEFNQGSHGNKSNKHASNSTLKNLADAEKKLDDAIERLKKMVEER